ncbi:MAG: SPOR domain-containing protein [Treponema sp.]|jgi:cell division protein FtsN|nr:SPOR domain-containing protein [Treponema sp.]
MEKKKILLIAIITGVFLTAVILFPLVLLSNNKATATAAAVVPAEIYNPQPASADVMEMVTTPTQQRETSQNITINNFSPDANAVESAKNPDGSVTINVLPAGPSQPTTITQTPISETPNQPAPTPTVSTPVVEKPATSPAPPKQPTTQTQTPTRSTTPAKTTPAKPTTTTPAVKTTPKPQEKSEYWIQTGSFTVKANADKAKALLDGEGIPNVVVENSVVKERTVFRIRSGPHRTKSEAEFWLKLVKAMDGFKESYVLEK